MDADRGPTARNGHGIHAGYTENKGFWSTLAGLARRVGWTVPKSIELKVHLAKDEQTGRWYVAESDIPGLRIEAVTPEEMIRKVGEVAPDLIELNVNEILANAGVRRQTASKARPALGIRPVFDTPMAVAC